jgi:hypothetical protein
MQKYNISVIISLLFLVSIGSFVYKYLEKKPKYNLTINRIDKMPLVQDDPFAHLAKGGVPQEQRDEKFRKWLSPCMKIKVKNASGSGTIVYYDSKENYAYLQSCGHLWSGDVSAEEAKRRAIKCKVITWYHNDQKLNEPKEYNAEVLYFSNSRGRDCSLLRFQPDWKPNYLPIAPADFKLEENYRLHSVGCDGGEEVAHYDVKYIGTKKVTEDGWYDWVTTENSPRPGRSGGGLMTDNYYVGICWGTSEYDGTGNGFFTPLSTVRQYNKMNGYDWLNDVGHDWIQNIPIIDRNNPQKEYPKDYIPLPGRF